MKLLIATTLAVAVCVARMAPHLEEPAGRAIAAASKLTVREVSERVFQVYQASLLWEQQQR